MTHSDVSSMDDALQALFGPDAILDGNGNVRLDFRGDVSLVLECRPEAQTAFLHAFVARADDGAILAQAMAWNLFGLSPAGAWLALEAEAGALLLCRAVPIPCGSERLDTILAEHLSGVASLRARIAGASIPDAQTQPWDIASYSLRL